MTTFAELMNIYMFNKFPRDVGFPSRRLVFDYNEFYSEIYKHHGEYPIFTSHNSFQADMIDYVQMFFDLDGKLKTLEDAYEELIYLYDEFSDYNKVMSFSGNGFHFYLRMKPIQINAQRLMVRDFQKDLNLSTLDLVCAEPKHIVRVPGTLYVKRGNIVTDRYCIPINRELLSKGIDEIIKASKARDISHFEHNVNKRLYNTDEIIGEERFVFVKSGENETGINWKGMSKEDLAIVLKAYLDEKIVNKLIVPKPDHVIRYVACVQLKTLGRIPLDEMIDIFDVLSQYWYDGKNKQERDKQVIQIYDRDYQYKRSQHVS